MRRRRAKLLVPLLLVAAIAVAVTSASASRSKRAAIVPAPAFTASQLAAYPAGDWLTSGGGLTDNRYTTLDQINTSNLSSLKVAWHAHFGLTKAQESKAFGEEASPVAYQGTLYVPDAFGDVVALDGATGEQLWKYDHKMSGKAPLLLTQRGLAIGAGHIYLAAPDDRVIALDQGTGRVSWSRRIGSVKAGESMSAAPLYYDGEIIVGMSGGDLGARGFVEALDAGTGKIRWRWYVAPGPGQRGHATWAGAEWKHSGSVWVYPSVDSQLGLFYVVTGNPVPWNGRGPGANKWTDSIVALHVDTGKFAWGFQTVHHDIWDYDVTNPPVLFDDVFHGKLRHGIAVASKTGWVYVLDRATGKPLLPIPEKKVPTYPKGSEAAKYANLSPTQPFPAGDALLDQCAQKRFWSGAAPDGKPFRVGCIFTPYSVGTDRTYTAFAPGPASIDWPPSSYDPQTHYLYVCANETHGGGIAAQPKAEQKLTVGGLYIGVNFAFSKGKPPKKAGRVVAVDLRTNRIVWRDVFTAACYSGNLTTSSGLDFVGQTNPRVLTALDVGSGKRLWSSSSLDASPMAPPITYMANGRQYIAVVAGGGGSGGGITSGRLGDSIYAFAIS